MISFQQFFKESVNYAHQHKNRHLNHTFTDIDSHYSRQKQTFVPDYAKAKTVIETKIDHAKDGQMQMLTPSELSQICSKYKINLQDVNRGMQKQLGRSQAALVKNMKTGRYMLIKAIQ